MKVAVSRAVCLRECPLRELLLLLFSPLYKKRLSTINNLFRAEAMTLSFLNISVVFESVCRKWRISFVYEFHMTLTNF